MYPTRTHAGMALAVALATAGTPHLGQAQFTMATPTKHHWLALGFDGGEIIPTGNATTNYKKSFQGAAIVAINLGFLPELRFSFGYQRFNFKDQVLGSLGIPSVAAAHNNVLAGVAGTRIDLLRTPIRPYLTVGVGAFDFKTVVDTGAKASRAAVPNASSIKFGIDGGAGLALDIGRFEAFAEGRVQNVFTSKGMISSAKQIQAVPVAFGFMFKVL